MSRWRTLISAQIVLSKRREKMNIFKGFKKIKKKITNMSHANKYDRGVGIVNATVENGREDLRRRPKKNG